MTIRARSGQTSSITIESIDPQTLRPSFNGIMPASQIAHRGERFLAYRFPDGTPAIIRLDKDGAVIVNGQPIGTEDQTNG